MFLYVSDNYLNSFDNIVPIIFELKGSYDISVSKSIDKKLGYPYNPCTEMTNKTYRFANCFDSCIHTKVANKYNCSMKGYYKIQSLKECYSEPGIYPLVYNESIEFRDICRDECPKECESIIYASSSSKLGDGQYIGFYEIHFSTFSYLEITQIPKLNFFSLISNIGGSLGLFIGFSFLSLVEILEFIIDIILIIFFFNHFIDF